jgi:Secretion system C-terminal sorting domain
MKKIYSLLFMGMSFGANAQITFYLNSLSTGNPVIIDHQAITNDNRGGIAVTQNNVYVTGDSSTGVFNTALTTENASGFIRDAMVCNISGNGGVYSLSSNGTPMQFFGPNGGGDLTELIKLDPTTLAATTTVVALSTPITLNNFIGIFSGTGYCLIQDENFVYKIDFLTGVVTILTSTYNFGAVTRNYCENGASWGVAEYDGTNYSMAYVKNNTTIESRFVNTSLVRQTFSFVNIGNMCSFILSPWNNRWYFHYEGNAQFGGTIETLGSAEASFTGSVPLNVGFTELIAAQKNISTSQLNWKVQKESNITKFVVEKLNSKNEFYKIGEVIPNGTYYYTFMDNEATDSKNFYRISAVEVSGDIFYSKVVNTNNSYRTIQDIAISPNPASNNINIFLGAKAVSGQLEIMNSMGQIISTQIINKDFISVNTENFPIGLYHVRIQNADFIGSGKFIKK